VLSHNRYRIFWKMQTNLSRISDCLGLSGGVEEGMTEGHKDTFRGERYVCSGDPPMRAHMSDLPRCTFYKCTLYTSIK
jgi:hypothetical protein